MSPRYGGPSVALADLTRLLRERGVDTTLITTNSDSTGRLSVPLGIAVDQGGARVVYFNVWPRGRYALSVPLARALHRTIRDYDVVHIHWLYNFSSLAAAFLASRAGVPYLVQPNGSLNPHLMRKNRTLKRLYQSIAGEYTVKRASGLVFTADAERRQVGLDVGRTPTYVVPVGLDWRQYAQLPIRGRFRSQYPDLCAKRIVLFVGRLSPQKGLDLLIAAFRAVVYGHPDAHLVIAGPDGDGYGELVKRWVAEARLGQHVSLVGRISDEMKLAAYVDADVFALPSYAENFGAVVTEALACQTPVVISDRVNICEEIARAEAGIVAKCSPESVADGINRVLSEPSLAVRMALNGREMVKQGFTWDSALQLLIPIYQRVAQSRRVPSVIGAAAR